MAENRDELADTLQRLHAQLAEAERIDPELRELLRNALDEIRDALDQGGGAGGAGEGESLGDRLAEMTQHFEDSHPALAATIGRLVNTLANLGI